MPRGERRIEGADGPKGAIRERAWTALAEAGAARFPGARGRIPAQARHVSRRMMTIWLMRTLPNRLSAGRGRSLEAVWGQHRLPRGPSGRLLARALAAESAALARGRKFPLGASLAAVARRRETER
jgi:hypothetical protein